MRVAEEGEEVEVLLEEGGGVAEGCDDEDAFSICECSWSGGDDVEVDVLDGGCVYLYGLVVVEDDGGLEVRVPDGLFVGGELDGGFRGSPAVEPGKSVREALVAVLDSILTGCFVTVPAEFGTARLLQ